MEYDEDLEFPMAGEKQKRRRVVLEVRDLRSNVVRLAVRIEDSMGAVRNEVNKQLGVGFAVGEHDIVPVPWAHYIADDPELFGKGPSDDWRVVDVFYEALTSGLARSNDVVVLRATSTSALAEEARLGLVFPDLRPTPALPEEADRFVAAASRILGREHLGDRAKALVSSLASVEKLCVDDKGFRERVQAVAGFGLDGEIAALVFVGSLTFEDALRALEATEGEGRRYRAYSALGKVPEGVEVSHHVLEGRAFVVVSESHDLPLQPLDHPLLESTAAHTALCAVDLDDADFDISEPLCPFYSRGRRQLAPSLRDTLRYPVEFSATVSAMVDDASLTRLVEAGASKKLGPILRHVVDLPLETAPL